MVRIDQQKNVQNVSVGINHGDAFFSDTVTIANNPRQFVLDFKQATPRFDQMAPDASKQQTTIILKHNTIILDAAVAKILHQLLGERIDKYEESFGEIKIQVQKPQAPKEEKFEATSVRPDYFG